MEYADKQEVSLAALDEQRQLWIDTLSHARHDWMNDLQLLLGYVQLRKYDKIAQYVDMLKQRMAEESRVSKLGHPGLIEALLTYKTRNKPYEFVLRIGQTDTEDLRDAAPVLNAAERVVRRLLTGFEASALRGESGDENRLECSVETKPKGVMVLFIYQGAYAPSQLRHEVDGLRANGLPLVTVQCKEQYEAQEAQVEVHISVSNS